MKTKLTFLEDDNKKKYEKKDAANLAKEMMQKIYTNEKISLDSIMKLKHGKPFDKKVKEELNKPFTVKEILNAIRLTPNKSPGPSGIKITLFKTFSQQFAPILTEIANEAMEKGSTSEFLMKGIITLIPKKEDSNNVNDLRPITLLEIPRKIITKAMTLRIKKSLSENILINENQYCHPGRIIHENIHTLNFLIQEAKDKGKNLHAAFRRNDKTTYTLKNKTITQTTFLSFFLNQNSYLPTKKPSKK